MLRHVCVKHVFYRRYGTHFILIFRVFTDFVSLTSVGASMLSHVTVRVPLLKAIILRDLNADWSISAHAQYRFLQIVIFFTNYFNIVECW